MKYVDHIRYVNALNEMYTITIWQLVDGSYEITPFKHQDGETKGSYRTLSHDFDGVFDVMQVLLEVD